jgi:predicted amidohydrolase
MSRQLTNRGIALQTAPSDFSFPTNGIKADATPNTETTLIADVDVDLLKELHSFESVRNLKDRRADIYKIVNRSKR